MSLSVNKMNKHFISSLIFVAAIFIFFTLPKSAQAIVSNYQTTNGSDASNGTAGSFSASDLVKLNASDDSRIQSNNWPNNSSDFDENRYIEFIFSPNLPTNISVSNVTLTHEFRRSGTLTAAKLEVWDGNIWHNETLTLPASSTDFSESKDVTSYSNSSSSVNGIKVRFLAFRGGSVETKTSHDFINLAVTYNLPDTVSPVISLIGPSIIDLTVGDNYSDAGATASDDMDGDISNNIVVLNSVNTAVVGNYTVSYNVSDTAGNPATGTIRTINVISAPPPTPSPTPASSGNASGSRRHTASSGGEVLGVSTSIYDQIPSTNNLAERQMELLTLMAEFLRLLKIYFQMIS